MSMPDINRLYQRVIRSNERLHQLRELGAPDILVRSELRAFEDAISVLMRDEDIADFAEDIGAQAFSVCFGHIAGSTMPPAENAIKYEGLADGH
ncbi:MAG: hypothetical protein ACR2OV_03075 [Hyphomicrobiaceae bacterium]